MEHTHTSRHLLKLNLTKLTSLRERQVVQKLSKSTLNYFSRHKPQQGTDRMMVANRERGSPLLAHSIYKNNQELITRMEDNLQQMQHEIQNKLKNPNLGERDRQLWTLFACKAIEQLEHTTMAKVAYRERRRTCSSLCYVSTYIYIGTWCCDRGSR